MLLKNIQHIEIKNKHLIAIYNFVKYIENILNFRLLRYNNLKYIIYKKCRKVNLNFKCKLFIISKGTYSLLLFIKYLILQTMLKVSL